MTPLCSLPRWMRGSIAGLALAAPAGAAPTLAEAKLAPGVYASAEAAVAAAAGGARERSAREDREHLGGVFCGAAGTAFVYSAAEGRRGADTFSVRLRAPAGYRLAAIWHTHGAPGLGRALFSARDTALAEELGVPVYLATPGGEIRVFRPGDATLSVAQARRRGVGWQPGLALGAPVDPRAAELARVARGAGAAPAEPASRVAAPRSAPFET